MALLTKKEFAGSCGMQTKKLSVYISRGKVIIDDNGSIDDENIINMQFREHALLKGQKPEISKPDKPKKEREPKARKQPSAPKPKVDKKKLEQITKKFNLDAEKREVEIQKIRNEVELSELKKMRQAGKVIPTEMIRGMLAKYFKNVTIEYKQSVDTIVTIFAKKTKMHINDKAEMKAQLVRTINEAVENTVEATKRELRGIVSEYSEG